jgi:FixJ family two-component response regulator
MSHAAPIVFVVDDDVSVRESLESLIRCAGWQPETFASAQEFLARPRVDVPSCLVLDVTLPDLNGLDLQQRIAGERTDLPIIFITGYGDIPMTVQAMKAGAVEFLTKPLGDEVLLNAIQNAIERSHSALIQEAEIRALWDCYASLSRREREVMALVVSGLLNKQIGGELGISEMSVKAHRGQVMRKMKADSLADLVILAVRLGVFVEADPNLIPAPRQAVANRIVLETAGKAPAAVDEEAGGPGARAKRVDGPAPIPGGVETLLGAKAAPAGGPYATREVGRRGSAAPRAGGGSPALIEPLSDRELEVLRLVAAGLRAAEIAAQLFVSEGTVRRHLHNLYCKLGVTGGTRAVAQGRALGLL